VNAPMVRMGRTVPGFTGVVDLLRAIIPAWKREDHGPYRWLPVERTVGKETVLIAWHGYFRMILRNVAPDLGDPVKSREELF
jgi:hypothetical protein